MIDYVQATEGESTRFATAIDRVLAAGSSLDDPRVPTCPDWSLADLAWHLTEVQHFWAAIVGQGLASPADYDRPERPPTDQLPASFAQGSQRLVEVLAAADPDQPCWSWHAAGDRVAWVRRRQAHEALIHRIDAELAAATVDGSPTSPDDATLSADGVDEMLAVMLDASSPPPWATWQPHGRSAELVATVDGGSDRAWRLELGHLVGDEDGTARDLEALVVEIIDPAEGAASDVTVRAPAQELNRWIWGRGELGEGAVIEGDPSIVTDIRAIAAVE